MNRKSIIVAAALAAASMSGFAIEAEQFVPPASQLSREEVRAELRELRAAGAWEPVNEASATPLQAAALDAKIAQLQSQTVLAQSAPLETTGSLQSDDALMALVEPAVTIEAVPLDQVEATPESQAMFQHPAIADQDQVEATPEPQAMLEHPAVVKQDEVEAQEASE